MTTSSSRRPGPARRRQRSTRIWVAGALLVLAVLAVAGAALSGSWLVATIAAGLAVALGAGATRITYAEVVDSRREAARDRAQQAQDYLALTQVRTAEQATYVAETSERLATVQARVERLEQRLSVAAQDLAEARRDVEEQRATAEEHRDRADQAEAAGERLTARLSDADERAAQAIVRVAELEQELDVVLAEWRAGNQAPLRKRA